MYRNLIRLIVFALLCLLVASACPAVSAEAGSFPAQVLPSGGFSPDWALKGKPVLYNPDNLFEHINGEAELFMPYGFERLATATYITGKDADAWLVADVYKMGSLLDAFGIYSNYRRADAEAVRIGADGFISPTQMMFYQDRYFVRLQITEGEASNGRSLSAWVASCRAICRPIPVNQNRSAYSVHRPSSREASATLPKAFWATPSSAGA